MPRILRILLLVLALVAARLALWSTCSAADFSAIWDGSNGNWDDPLHWSTNPNYPDNTGGLTYNATVNAGTVTLDRDITIQRFSLNNGTLGGAFALDLNEGFEWTGGLVDSLTTINLAKGSSSIFVRGALRGTLNNSGVITQAGPGYLVLSSTGI